MDILNPITITCAIFIAIFFTDLFTHNYKNLAVHALIGLFCILIVAALYELHLYGTAWLFVASPFLIIIGSILIRDHRNYLSGLNTLRADTDTENCNKDPYFI
jgi:hypothetical protein